MVIMGRVRMSQTRQGLRRVRPASIAAEAGAPTPATAAPRTATAIPRASAATAWASASLSLQVYRKAFAMFLSLNGVGESAASKAVPRSGMRGTRKPFAAVGENGEGRALRVRDGKGTLT